MPAATTLPTIVPQTTGPHTSVPETLSTVPGPTPPGPTAPGSMVSALTVLQSIPIQLEHGAGYNRDLFAVWSDLDGDGCDTREEVLRSESLVTALLAANRCTVISGEWLSSYDGSEVSDPSALDIDHVVALKEAWDSGAWAWSPERRIAYANDQTDGRTLAAVSAASNRSKGDADPSNWLPDEPSVCRYLGDWIAIKARWALSMDQSEWGRIKNLLQGACAGTEIEPWPAAPAG